MDRRRSACARGMNKIMNGEHYTIRTVRTMANYNILYEAVRIWVGSRNRFISPERGALTRLDTAMKRERAHGYLYVCTYGYNYCTFV
jgi:hypothetical protein